MLLIRNSTVLLAILFLLHSCSNLKNEEKLSIVKKDNLDEQMIEAYKEGIKELERGDVIYAAKKFNEAELLYPQSAWAPRSVLMAAYAYYSQIYYSDAIFELERFLLKYKNHPQTDYAYYLLALCYYDQIVDEKKDLEKIIEAQKYFNIVLKNYPNTDYAIDSTFKLDLINEVLASKELYLARYYAQREKWIPAINRFKVIIDDYDGTIFVEEALHRLVEIYYKIGMIEESRKYAKLLGYNYQSSEWYKASYKIFNTNYSLRSKENNKDKQNSILNRFKEIFN